MRRVIPRYSKENFPNVLKVVEEIQQVGKKHNASAGQVTLAWLLAQGPDVIPIPGTRNVKVRKKRKLIPPLWDDV
jgi:aryl-alcohol dehydrogenase-like predicted oxidoreductase